MTASTLRFARACCGSVSALKHYERRRKQEKNWGNGGVRRGWSLLWSYFLVLVECICCVSSVCASCRSSSATNNAPPLCSVMHPLLRVAPRRAPAVEGIVDVRVTSAPLDELERCRGAALVPRPQPNKVLCVRPPSSLAVLAPCTHTSTYRLQVYVPDAIYAGTRLAALDRGATVALATAEFVLPRPTERLDGWITYQPRFAA